jgi:ATP-dependent DNA helicase RecQ
MALKYPVSLHELIHIHGVGEGKNKNMVFVRISQYVIDNEILRPDDLVVKSTGIKSA